MFSFHFYHLPNSVRIQIISPSEVGKHLPNVFSLPLPTTAQLLPENILPFLVAQTVKNLTVRQETWIGPWAGKIPWRRE